MGMALALSGEFENIRGKRTRYYKDRIIVSGAEK